MKKIAIDAGHGGEDPGALSPNKKLKEKDVVLEISKMLNYILEYKGYNTILIRDKDEFVQLGERANKANKEKADIFVSVHTNAAASKNAHGIETFYFKNSKQGEKLARHIQKEMVNLAENRNRGIKTNQSWTVLKRTNMPAVLCEVGFISNKEEKALLSNEYFRFMKAFSIYKGIENYFNEVS